MPPLFKIKWYLMAEYKTVKKKLNKTKNNLPSSPNCNNISVNNFYRKLLLQNLFLYFFLIIV